MSIEALVDDGARAEVRQLLDALALVHGEDWEALSRELADAVWGNVELRDRWARALIADAAREMVRARSRRMRLEVMQYRQEEPARVEPMPTPPAHALPAAVRPAPEEACRPELPVPVATQAPTPQMEQFVRMAVKGQLVGVDASRYRSYQLTGGTPLPEATGAEILRDARWCLAKGRSHTIKGLWLRALGSRLKTGETFLQAGLTDSDLDKMRGTAEYQARVLLARAGVA
jgi:hypothetical protein